MIRYVLAGSLVVLAIATTAGVAYRIGAQQASDSSDQYGILPDDDKWSATYQLPHGEYEGMHVCLDIRRKKVEMNSNPGVVSVRDADAIITSNGVRITENMTPFEVAIQHINTRYYTGGLKSKYQVAGGMRRTYEGRTLVSRLNYDPSFVIGDPSTSARNPQINWSNGELHVDRFTTMEREGEGYIEFVYDVVLAIRDKPLSCDELKAS